MTPAKPTTLPADMAWARSRRQVAERYVEVADLVDAEDGAVTNVCLGLLTLAGIAAGDAICAAALGAHYVGADQAGAATLLARVNHHLGAQLKTLVDLQPGAHEGNALLRARQRGTALRAAHELVAQARARTI